MLKTIAFAVFFTATSAVAQVADTPEEAQGRADFSKLPKDEQIVGVTSMLYVVRDARDLCGFKLTALLSTWSKARTSLQRSNRDVWPKYADGREATEPRTTGGVFRGRIRRIRVSRTRPPKYVSLRVVSRQLLSCERRPKTTGE